MKIAYASDLHIEFYKDETVPVFYENEEGHPITGPYIGALKAEKPDVFVLAGDVWNTRYIGTYIGAVSEYLEIPVLYVPGNHEFYGWDYHRALSVMKKDASKFSNAHVMTRGDIIDIEDGGGKVRFIGGILWTDLGGDDEHWMYGDALMDFQLISYESHLFRTVDMVNEHIMDRDNIEFALSLPAERKVVITHHGPSQKCNKMFVNSNISDCFLCDMEHLMTDEALKVWIYGHTHDPCDVEIHGTKVISSQRGYPGELEHEKHWWKIIEV